MNIFESFVLSSSQELCSACFLFPHSSWHLTQLCGQPKLFFFHYYTIQFSIFSSLRAGPYFEEWSGKSHGKWWRLRWSVCWTIHYRVLCLLIFWSDLALHDCDNLSKRIFDQGGNRLFDFINYCHSAVVQSFMHNWME